MSCLSLRRSGMARMLTRDHTVLPGGWRPHFYPQVELAACLPEFIYAYGTSNRIYRMFTTYNDNSSECSMAQPPSLHDLHIGSANMTLAPPSPVDTSLMLWSAVDECDASSDVTGCDVIADHVIYEDGVNEDNVDAAAVDDDRDYEQLVLSATVRRQF